MLKCAHINGLHRHVLVIMVTVRQALPQAQTPTAQLEIDQATWIAQLSERLGMPLANLANVCDFVKQLAKDNHSTDQGYRSDAYVTGVAIADILSHLHVDEDALICAMLFRCVRQNLIEVTDIAKQFGPALHQLMVSVLAMGQLSNVIGNNRKPVQQEDLFVKEYENSIYKMLLSVTEDVRVVLIKLAERSFALRELAHASAERKRRVSAEIFSIYAPLAHRLGIAQLKWELEDLAFRYLAPNQYQYIAGLLAEKRSERESFIHQKTEQLGTLLKQNGIAYEVSGRVKHIYSIFRKMRAKNLSFDQLYDIRALRVLVASEAECYRVLGVIHQLWRPLPNQFDDYIGSPKNNGYRSLHTAVLADGKSLEVQIRTHTMHQEAELGVCAHFNYKENNTTKDANFSLKLQSLRQVLESNIPMEAESGDYTQDIKHTLNEWADQDNIYVFTRDGEVKELPKDATVLDFAYHIHTEVGNQCYAARVNQRPVPLSYQLKTGQQVAIYTHPEHQPNRNWLQPSLGFINTVHARNKLKNWLKQQSKQQNIHMGRDLVNQALEQLAIHPSSIDLHEFLPALGLSSVDDCLIAIATGEIAINQVLEPILEQLYPNAEQAKRHIVALDKGEKERLTHLGVMASETGSVLLELSACCKPSYPQALVGELNAERSVSVHAASCVVIAGKPPKHSVALLWQQQEQLGQQVHIVVSASDRRGLLKDVTEVVLADNINIMQVNTFTDAQGLATLRFAIEVAGLAQLSDLLAKLEQVASVTTAQRELAG